MPNADVAEREQRGEWCCWRLASSALITGHVLSAMHVRMRCVLHRTCISYIYLRTPRDTSALSIQVMQNKSLCDTHFSTATVPLAIELYPAGRMEAVETSFSPIQPVTCGGADQADGDHGGMTGSPVACSQPPAQSSEPESVHTPPGPEYAACASQQHMPAAGRSEGDARQANDRWGQLDTPMVEPGGHAPDSSHPSCRVTRARAVATASELVEAAAPVTVDMLANREASMFVVGAAAVVESGIDAVATVATNQLAILIDEIVSGWSREHVEALRASFVNFDRDVGRGWLACDALGLPLVSRADAWSVGSAVRKRAVKVNKKIASLRAAPLRNAGKLDAEARQRLIADADTAVTELLREGVEPPLPLPAAPAAPLPLPSPATASVKRQRAPSAQEQLDARVERALAKLSQTPPPKQQAAVADAAGLRGALRALPAVTPSSSRTAWHPPPEIPRTSFAKERAEQAVRSKAAALAADKATAAQLEENSTFLQLRSTLVQAEEAYIAALRVPFFSGWPEAARAAGDAADAASAAWDAAGAAEVGRLEVAAQAATAEFEAALDDEALPQSAIDIYLDKSILASHRCSAMRRAWPRSKLFMEEQRKLGHELSGEREAAFRAWKVRESPAHRAEALLVRENSNLRHEIDELREDLEEAWEHIVHMREACASIMCTHAPSVEWSRQLACERDRYLTPPQMALARRWCDWAHFPDAEDIDWEGPCVSWDGHQFVCQPSMLCVYRPLELGHWCAGLGGSDVWNAYAQPQRTEKAARAFRSFTCRARRHARSRR